MNNTTGKYPPFTPSKPLDPEASRPATGATSPAPATGERVVGQGFAALLGMESREPEGPMDVDDPTFTPPARGDVEAASRMWMTAMKMFRPIFSAVIEAPVEQIDPPALMGTFFTLLKATNRLAERVAHHLQSSGLVDLSVNDQRWTLRRVIPHVAQSVAEQWRTHGQVDETTLEPLYQGLIAALARDDLRAVPPGLALDQTILEVCAVDEHYLRLSAPEALKVSLLNAMQPLIAEVSLFSCWQPAEALLGPLAQIITENAERLYQLQAVSTMSDRGRAVLLQATLKHAGEQVRESYRIEASALLAHYDGLSDAQQEGFRAEQIAPAALQRLCQTVAKDAHTRCQLLHQAALAGAESLDALLRNIGPTYPSRDVQL